MNRDEGFSVVPMCNEEPSSKDSFEERVKLYVMGTKEEHRCLCGPRVLADMDPEKQPYQVIRAAITTVQLTGDGGAYLMVSALLAALETTTNPRSSATLPTADGWACAEKRE